MDSEKILLTYREQIDTIDHEIIYLLSRRFENVKQIGKIKKDHNIPPLQPQRFETLLKNLFEEGDDKGISRELIKDLWNRIHKESLRLEKEYLLYEKTQ